MRPDQQDRWIDALLAAAALSLALLTLLNGAQASDAAPPSIAPDDVAAIEEVGLTLDADRALDAQTRTSIGLDGEPEATPAVVLSALKDEIREDLPRSVEARLLWVALATSFRLDDAARGELLDLAADGKTATTWAPTLDGLANLASGRRVDDMPTLEKAFTDLGASRWLVEHLRERELANAGDEDGRRASEAKAIAIADATMDRRALFELIMLGMGALGLMVFVLFPWLARPRLEAAGYPGLDGPSPFRIERTRRVVLAWLIAYFVAGYVVIPAVAAIGGLDTPVFAIGIILNSIVHGGAAIAFIQIWARKEADATAITRALGLTTATMPGGFRGFLVWVLPASGVVFMFTQLAMIANQELFGPDRDVQLPLQLLTNDPATFPLIAIGACLVAPAMEEILFRGFLYRNLREAIGRPAALVVSGLAFGAVHFDASKILPIAVMGIGLAMVYEWSGSLLVPIAAHAIWNLAQLLGTALKTQV